MGTPIGNLGGIAVIQESVYGTTPAVPGWIWQHPVGSSYGNRREIITPTLLSYAAHINKKYSGIYSDGEASMGLDFNESVIGEILGLVGAGAAGVYKLGDGSIPDAESISLLQNYGGGGATQANNLEYIFPGVKPNAIRIEIVEDSNSTITLVGIGKPGVKTILGSSVTPAPPSENDVVMPSGIGVVTVGVGETWETVVCLHSSTMEVLVPKTGFDRRCLNGTMKEPITNGRPSATFTLNLDLDDATDNDTIGLLEAFNAGDNIGDITLGSEILIKDAIMGGDFPSLAEGLLDFTISGEASYIQMTAVV